MINNRKNGFTLVELLAVIAVLGLIIIIAIPKVMETLNTQKKRTLELTTKSIIKAAEEKYLENSAYGINEEITCESVSNITNSDFNSCDIEFDEVGNATVTIIGKGRYDDLSCQGTKDNVTCQKGEIQRGLQCTFDGELVKGAEFTHNQYTYRYKEEYVFYEDENGEEFIGWVDLNEDGWHVRLTDKTSTEPVNTPVCSYINGKPLVSTSFMFVEIDAEFNGLVSLATEIDVSSWDTNNVTNMMGMFMYTMNTTEIKGLNKLETGKVTNMMLMFGGTSATSLDISNFNTSNVINMMAMFGNTIATSLDISNFDTSKVTNMGEMFASSAATTIKLPTKWTTGENANMSIMFYDSAATSLDLSGLDTSKVTDMSEMFADSSATMIKLPTKWTTGENANMSGMFSYSAATSLDLSGLDTSKVTDMSNMFAGSSATMINLPTKWTTGENANMSFMFYDSAATMIKFPNEWITGENANMSEMFRSSAATSLDLSGLDTSKVIDMSGMFRYAKATTGYARTEADADKLNASSNKPTTLTFVVKPTS